MNKRYVLLLACLILCLSISCQTKDLIPSQFEYEGVKYTYDPTFKEFESIVKADIDGDSREETIVMFGTREKAVIPFAFVFVYGKDYEFRIPLYDYPGKIEVIDIDGDGKKELFLYGHGGAHYTKLFVYKYERNRLHKIFENGSACPVEFDAKSKIIKVGRANWEEKDWCYASGEPLWEVYQWNGKEFEYKRELSTTEQISELEEAERFVNQVLSDIKEGGKDE